MSMSIPQVGDFVKVTRTNLDSGFVYTWRGVLTNYGVVEGVPMAAAVKFEGTGCAGHSWFALDDERMPTVVEVAVR